MTVATPLHRWLSRALAAAIAVQFFLAGAGAFGAHDYAPHRALGWGIAGGALAGFVVALAARRYVRHAALLALVTVLQVALALGADDEPWLGALHGLNALAVMGAAGTLAGRYAPRRRRSQLQPD